MLQLFFWKKKTDFIGLLLIIRSWTQQIEIFYQDYKTRRKNVSNCKKQKIQSFCQMSFPKENRKCGFIFLITSNGIKHKMDFKSFHRMGTWKKNRHLRREEKIFKSTTRKISNLSTKKFHLQWHFLNSNFYSGTSKKKHKQKLR